MNPVVPGPRGKALRAPDSKSEAQKRGIRLRHDLRSHLQTIMGYSDLLHEEKVGSLNPKQHEFLDNIVSATSTMLALLESVEKEAGGGGTA